jgi:hypothetical protein
MRMTKMMGRQSSLLSQYLCGFNTWNKLLVWTILIGLTLPSAHTLSLASEKQAKATNDSVELKSTKTSSAPVSASADLRPSRTNSRFLRNFPPYDFINFARTNGLGDESSKRTLVNGNSPVFYIRLPPAPYVLVPGFGYISPHPYSSHSPALANSVVMSPDAMMPGGGGGHHHKEPSGSKNVISLPLKFLSNGRPSQIESPTVPTKKLPPKKQNISDSKITTALLSGGKYSFNGRPNGVFIVRSPVQPTAPARMSFLKLN